MTTTDTTPEVTTIDHLDFDVPCGVTSPTCSDVADWWVVAGAHCRPDGTSTGFMCPAHFDRLMGGDLFRCATCNVRESPLERVIRTERIR